MQLTPEMLADIIRQATAVPLHAVKEMQKEMLQTQLDLAERNISAQAALLKQLASPSEADPLRKLREKDPQCPQFTGKTEHFLAWVLECQTRKEQRDLPDAVAIQYAIMAMGETF